MPDFVSKPFYVRKQFRCFKVFIITVRLLLFIKNSFMN